MMTNRKGILSGALILIAIAGITASASSICSVCDCFGTSVDCSKTLSIVYADYTIPATTAKLLDFGLVSKSSVFLGSELTGLSALNELWMISIGLMELKASFFPALNSLLTLKLSQNPITKIDVAAFTNIPNLEVLEISSCYMTTLPASVFSTLTNLRSISLALNDFNEIPEAMFQELTSLLLLDFSKNFLSTLPSDVFINLTQLQYLFLNGNEFQSIPVDVLDTLTSLKQLGFSYNEITTVANNSFVALPNLENLDLSSNSISQLMPGALNGINALSLDFSENFISSFPALFFAQATKLLALYLHGNNISILRSNLLTNSPSLTILFLQDNNVTEIEERFFSNISASLQALILDRNPSECLLGQDLLLGRREIYCACSQGFISRESDSCIAVSEVMVTGLPSLAAPKKAYDFSLPNNAPTPVDALFASLSTTCGALTLGGAGRVRLQIPDTVPTLPSACSISYNGSIFWRVDHQKDIWAVPFLVTHDGITLIQGQNFEYRLPTKVLALRDYSLEAQIVYAVNDTLPTWMTLDIIDGTVKISGAVQGYYLYSFSLQNLLSGLALQIAVVDFTVTNPPIVASQTSKLTPIAYAVPVGVAILVVLFIWLYIRRDRRKFYHVFISYRVRTDLQLAKNLCFRLQQRFLSSGHRVRVFWDRQDLQDGMPWEKLFMKGLKHSCVYLPLISEPSLHNIKALKTESKTDNFLLEMELALHYYTQKRMCIYPLRVGETTPEGWKIFDSSVMGKLDQFPDVPSPSAALSKSTTIRQTMATIFGIQGVKLQGPTLSDQQINDFLLWIDDFAWNRHSKTSLQLIRHWNAPKDDLQMVFAEDASRKASVDPDAPDDVPVITVDIHGALLQSIVPWVIDIFEANQWGQVWGRDSKESKIGAQLVQALYDEIQSTRGRLAQDLHRERHVTFIQQKLTKLWKSARMKKTAHPNLDIPLPDTLVEVQTSSVTIPAPADPGLFAYTDRVSEAVHTPYVVKPE